jgi:Protein of unknown function (DUF3159)
MTDGTLPADAMTSEAFPPIELPTRRMNLRILITGVPVLVFYLLTRTAPESVAVAGGFIAFAIVFRYTRFSKLYQMLSAVGFGVVATSAAVGIVWGSEKAYLASGPISGYIFAAICFGSVVIGRPIAGAIVREITPWLTKALPNDAPVLVGITVMWALYNVLAATVRIWLLMNLSVGEYLIWSRVLGWPMGGLLILVTGYFIRRASQRQRLASST